MNTALGESAAAEGMLEQRHKNGHHRIVNYERPEWPSRPAPPQVELDALGELVFQQIRFNRGMMGVLGQLSSGRRVSDCDLHQLAEQLNDMQAGFFALLRFIEAKPGARADAELSPLPPQIAPSVCPSAPLNVSC